VTVVCGVGAASAADKMVRRVVVVIVNCMSVFEICLIRWFGK
jgi:hypothetical protein